MSTWRGWQPWSPASSRALATCSGVWGRVRTGTMDMVFLPRSVRGFTNPEVPPGVKFAKTYQLPWVSHNVTHSILRDPTSQFFSWNVHRPPPCPCFALLKAILFSTLWEPPLTHVRVLESTKGAQGHCEGTGCGSSCYWNLGFPWAG